MVRVFVALVLLLGAVAGGCSKPPSASLDGVLPRNQRKPDIVFILIDTLRADRLGCYGHTGGLTPTMDAIAAEGVLLEHAFSAAPWTLPSIASLFTSYYPGVHKVNNYRQMSAMDAGQAAKISVLADEQFVTLAEALRANGYQTAGFCANKFIQSAYGFGQGFDHYEGDQFAENRVPGSKVNAAALAWLPKRDKKKPLFLYLHYMDVHGPYDAAGRFLDPLVDKVEKLPQRTMLPPGPNLGGMLPYLNKPPTDTRDPERHTRLHRVLEYWIARYEAGVAEMDFHLGAVRDALRNEGIWDNAYVIVTADHGESLFEHGRWDHGYTMFHPELHVPLLLRWPKVLPAGMRVTANASLLDVMPTLLAQLRVPMPQGLQGRSLLPHLKGPADDPQRGLLAEAIKAGPEQKAYYDQQWKLIALPQEQGLFDWRKDPRESMVLDAREPAQVQRLRQALDAQVRQNAAITPITVVPTADVSAEEQRRLSALGYADHGEEVHAHERISADQRVRAKQRARGDVSTHLYIADSVS